MSDWLGLGFILLLVAAALVAAARAGAPPKRITVEEFERRARTGGHTRAGLFAIQQWLHPKAVKAVEIQQDLKAGYYNKKRVPGDGDEPGAQAGGEVTAGVESPDDVESSNESEERDA